MYPNYSKAFLDLKDVFVKNVIQADSFLKVFIETRTSEQTCPCCGCKTKRVHDYRIQEIDDTPFQGKTVILVLRKRRYFCTSCGKRFLEHYSFLPSYHRRTRRLAICYISPTTDFFLKFLWNQEL
nr:transposase family protein [uncultured Clostridium sp.]